MGREGELQLIRSRLDDRRLVTLVGVAGVGKTSLAKAAAGEAAADFELGLRTVDLTKITAEERVRSTLAGQLGFPGFAELLESPIDRGVLLVVDNCEHVIDAAAEAIGELLDACDAPTVLATSRRPLDLPGETVVHIAPLPLPPRGMVDLDATSVQVFLARAADAGVPAADLDHAAVCELCRRLDGNPLALELAAARLRSISPQEILELIEDRLDVLDRPRYRGARRHRGLRAAIDWSYQLLDQASGELLDRLGAFSGPFDEKMVVAVAADPGTDRVEVLDVLDQLVSDCLLVADTSGTSTSYRLLESVRTYARERLIDRGLLEDTVGRLVDHLAIESLQIITDTSDQWDEGIVARLLALYPNLNAALRFCLENDAEPDRAELLAAILWGVVHQAHTSDIRDLATAVLDRWPDSTGALRADVVATVATCSYLMGELEQAQTLATGHLTTADSHPGSVSAVTLRRVLAQIAGAGGDIAGARAGFSEAAETARERGLLALQLELEADLARFIHDDGETEAALALLAEVTEQSRRANSTLTEIWGRSVEASILLEVDPPAALEVAQEMAQMSHDVGYPAGLIINLRTAALVLASQGRTTEAAEMGLRILDDLVIHGMLNELRMVLDALIAVLAVTGRHDRLGDLVATIDALPTVTMVARETQRLVPVPDQAGTALSRGDAIQVVREELRAVVAEGADHEAGSAEAEPAPAPAAPTQPAAVFRALGEFYEIGHGDQTAMLKASKGLRDLHRLVAQPNTEIHCLDLAEALVDDSAAGPTLDEQARRDYEARIIELQEELDDADAANDIGRSERASTELDALIDQLSSGLGLGGRDRTTGSSAERARSSVTQRIRTAIRRITDVAPRAGSHLQASVQTGLWCSYRPPEPVDWTLEG